MKHSIKNWFIFLLISILPLYAYSQQVNSLYFMENVPIRHILNPAFQPQVDFYLSLPIIGFSQFNIGNNSLTLKDIIYKKNGQTVTFLNDDIGINQFYNTLKPTTVIRTDLQTNILSFGFKRKSTFWNFSLNEKIDGMISIPNDLFQISFYGTREITNNSFNFTTLQSNFTLYTEAAFGLSTQLDDRLTIGAKIKFLLGSANISNINRRLTLNAGIDGLSIKGEGTINESGPVQIDFRDFQSISFTAPANTNDWLRPSGIGAGMDMGIDYRLNKNINLSAAITDLGFIRWTRNARNVNYTTDVAFNGVGQFSSDMDINTLAEVYSRFIVGNSVIDSVATLLTESSSRERSAKPYSTATTSKLNLGVEYKLLNNRLSLGLLSRTQIFKRIITEEITTSINARPSKWLNATLSYSLINGNWSTLGAGLGLTTGIFHWFVATDYIPFRKVDFLLTDIDPTLPNLTLPIPYNSKAFNLSVGMNLVFNARDKKQSKGRLIWGRCGDSKKPTFKAASNKSGPDNDNRSSKGGNVNSRTGLHRSKIENDCNCDWD